MPVPNILIYVSILEPLILMTSFPDVVIDAEQSGALEQCQLIDPDLGLTLFFDIRTGGTQRKAYS